jgi:hypothetical protein
MVGYLLIDSTDQSTHSRYWAQQIPDLHGLKAMTTLNYEITLCNKCKYFLIVMNFTVK